MRLAWWKGKTVEAHPIEKIGCDGYCVPPPGWARAQVTQHTPDLIKIEQYNHQWLFLYDQFQQKLGRHSLPIQHARYGGVALSDREFSVWKRKSAVDQGPIAVAEGFTYIPRAQVKGEVFLVNPSTLIMLDNLRRNGVEFIRRRMKIHVQYHDIVQVDDRDAFAELMGIRLQRGGVIAIPCSIELYAWMYIGKMDFWMSRLDAGYEYAPIQLMKPNSELKKPYYYFTNCEYNE